MHTNMPKHTCYCVVASFHPQTMQGSSNRDHTTYRSENGCGLLNFVLVTTVFALEKVNRGPKNKPYSMFLLARRRIHHYQHKEVAGSRLLQVGR